MKKVLIILGVLALAGLLLLLAAIFTAVTVIHGVNGRVLYSCVGEWTRVDEFAHAEGKTNYIVFADGQLTMYRAAQKKWRESTGTGDLSRLQKMQADAYARMDRNIKNGLNPLAYLDDTNPPPAVVPENPDASVLTNK